jgi:hypothetical protein
LRIHFSSGILAITLETKPMTRDEYEAMFEVKNSFGDVFAVTPFMQENLVAVTFILHLTV